MRVRILFLLYLVFLAGGIAFSQDCGCVTKFDFVVQKMEKNYAGFTDKVSETNREQYNSYTASLRQKALVEKNTEHCLKLMNEWLGFFRDAHIKITEKGKNNRVGSNPIAPSFYFKKVDNETNLVKIGSFNHLYKHTIDSIIAANYAAIISTKYLLIDLRGNSGGSDVSYEKLLPLLYTGEYEITGSSIFSTPDNIDKFTTILNDNNYPESSKNQVRDLVNKMRSSPGQFVGGGVDTVRFDNILPSPSLVGLLIDRVCGSSTEQFILAAKQSKKVVLFGENSGGVLDYSNLHRLDIPCNNWVLMYPTSRSMRLPLSPVDNIGIAPDVRINKDDRRDWVTVAEKYLQQMPLITLSNYHYTDTTLVDLKKMALDIAGTATTTFDKVRNIIWWTNKNFMWAYTDYERRTVKQIICRQGGNCNEQALVVRSLLREVGVQTRKTHEINIQPESEERQKSAEEQIAKTGNRASVFGYRHNDHVWTEFFDEESQQWIPADPTLGLIGLDNWLRSRIGFEPRVNHAIIASADMLVPIAVFAMSPDGTVLENRSNYYLIESFNRVYHGELEKLPSWNKWKLAVDFIQAKAREAKDAKINLHDYTNKIKELKEIYQRLKSEYESSTKVKKRD